MSPNFCFTFECRPYFVILTNGKSASVNAIPKTIPAIKPTKCCCHGNAPIPNNEPAIIINLINAICGFFNCFQCININKTNNDETTPANDANGPTYFC